MSNWTATSDEYPETYKDVLIYAPKRGMAVACLVTFGGDRPDTPCGWELRHSEIWVPTLDDVTHWMELPEKPGGEQ